MAQQLIQFNSLIVTPIQFNSNKQVILYSGKVDYLIKGDIRYSNTEIVGELPGLSRFFEVYNVLFEYATSIIYPKGDAPLNFKLGTIIFTPTTVTIRLPYIGKMVESNSGPGLRSKFSSLTKVPFSTIGNNLEELVAQWVSYIDTQARSEAAPR